MKNQDNNFKRTLLKELTGLGNKEADGETKMDVSDSDDFDYISASATEDTIIEPPVTSQPVANTQTAPVQAPVAPKPTGSTPTYEFEMANKTPETESLAYTTVSKSTVINGGIQSRENVVIEGVVNGDIVAKGKVAISGKVEGNVTGYDVDLTCEELTGDITSENKVVVYAATKLKGNIFSTKSTILGTVEGNVICKESIELMDNAIVYGDIKASSISVSEGAVIYGMVTIGKTKPDPSSAIF